jgi:hypothetical protein
MSFLVLRAYLRLIQFDLYLVRGNFQALYNKVRAYPIRKMPAPVNAAEQICAAVDMAWLQFAIAGGLAAVLIHPKSRAKILQAWNSVYDKARQAKGPVFEGFLVLMQQLAAAESDSTQTLRQVQAAMPPSKKGTAIVYVRRVCVLSAGPLAIEEIVRRMRNDGYVSRAKAPEAYIRRVMRESSQFVEDSSGMWKLRA